MHIGTFSYIIKARRKEAIHVNQAQFDFLMQKGENEDMAINYYQNGRLKTAVAVNLVDCAITDDWGSWSIQPSETVKVNTQLERIFQTVNRQSYMCGPEGRVRYEAADGSVFTICFDCPTSAPNKCNVSVGEGSPWKITGHVPSSGIDDINYDCTITQKSYQ